MKSLLIQIQINSKLTLIHPKLKLIGQIFKI
jgi:hypothetical protein